jgi:hypothetical protein
MAGLSADEEQTAEMCAEQSRRVCDDFTGGSMAIVYRELRLGLTRIGGVVEVGEGPCPALAISGQADLILIRGEVGLVLDYKTGRGSVESATRNAQLRGLAVLAAKHWGLSSVRVAIVQPWAGAPSVADYDEAALTAAEAWLSSVLRMAMSADPEQLSAGEWCKYCRAKAVCPALREAALAPVEMTDISGSLPSEPKNARAALFARAMDLPSERLARLYRGRRLVEWYLAAIEAAMAKRLTDGEDVPGHRLKPGVVREKIIDVGMVFERMTQSHGVSGERFSAACSLTKTAAKDMLREVTGLKGKALDAALDAALEGATEAKETAKQIEEVEE